MSHALKFTSHFVILNLQVIISFEGWCYKHKMFISFGYNQHLIRKRKFLSFEGWCSPKIHMTELDTQCDSIGKWGFWEVGHDVIMNVISILTLCD